VVLVVDVDGIAAIDGDAVDGVELATPGAHADGAALAVGRRRADFEARARVAGLAALDDVLTPRALEVAVGGNFCTRDVRSPTYTLLLVSVPSVPNG
jgi:hypothetical protein